MLRGSAGGVKGQPDRAAEGGVRARRKRIAGDLLRNASRGLAEHRPKRGRKLHKLRIVRRGSDLSGPESLHLSS